MRYLLAGLVVLAACGGTDGGGILNPPPKKTPKPDPYITVRLRHQMDTTTRAGRAHWAFYGLVTNSPNPAQNGVGFRGAISIVDVRLGHSQLCPSFDADSVGQRLVELVGFADTTTDELTPQVQFDARAQAWYAGNHVLPAGWDALTTGANDAFQSVQYDAGHGRTKADPILWGFDLTGGGLSTFYERTDNDTFCTIIPG